MRARTTCLFSTLITLFAFGAVAGCLVEAADGEAGPAGAPGSPGAAGEQGEQGVPGAGSERDAADMIPLFGANFFPEGVAARADGTLYVGSLGTGEIVRVPPGLVKPEPFVPAGALGRVGLLVDNATDTLWSCAADLQFASPGALVAFDATTGEEKLSIPFTGLCNDMTLDDAGNLYVTDSFGGIISRLPAGGDTLEVWAEDPMFAVPQGEFGLNGIAFDGGALYVAKTNEGLLFRVPIEAGGVAGAPLPITLDMPLAGPDGVKRLDADTLLVVDNGGGQVVQIKLTGTDGAVLVLRNYLDVPTTADVDGADAWVAEGQFDHLFGGDPSAPELPFKLQRVYLP